MKIIIKNIKSLVLAENSPREIVKGTDMKSLPCVDNAWMVIEGEAIAGLGNMENYRVEEAGATVIDARGKLVLPCWVDAHTHIVCAGSREGEFVDRIKGLTYEEVAARGGGILNSAKRMETASEEELLAGALNRVNEVIKTGTGALEIKSGYGLTVESELKMLRVIRKLKTLTPVTIKATFLGAHAIPEIYKSNRRGYVDILLNEMIPKAGEEKLADFCDVFCERNYFTKDETIEILECAKRYGMIPKVHANQLSRSGGVQAGVETGAISVDHLEFVDDEEIAALKDSSTMPVILPGAQWFLSLPYPPARKMIDNGLPLAICSDYNPGSCPSGNMNFMLSLACVQYKLTPEEVINAATINSAYAMGVSRELGSICVGKKANIIITKEIPGYTYIPYAFATDVIDKVIVGGKLQL